MIGEIGGGLYLLHKVFLWEKERAQGYKNKALARRWRIAAWAVYIVGLPFWLYYFHAQRNWIAGFVEVSGLPAMVLGLVIAIRGTDEKAPTWLYWLSVICAIAGFGASLYDFKGLTTLKQWLELGLVLGYLVGTYLLALDRINGYLWYMVMHFFCAYLTLIQGSMLLSVMQWVSFFFVKRSYKRARRSQAENTEVAL